MEQQTIDVSANFVSPEERMRLMRLCLGITGNIDVAEDLVQETLLEAWQHLSALRDQAKRSQWLSGIARNICLRWLRKCGRDAAHLVDLRAASDGAETMPANFEDALTDDFDIEVELERKELVELLDRAMALLPVETRAILVKRYVEESSLAELADQPGTNASAVAMRLQRGKLALRRVLMTDLRQEITPYILTFAIDGWEDTPIWCHLCGRHRLQGRRDASKGKLLLRCPNCSPGANGLLSYNELPDLKGIKGYKPLVSRLKNWCERNYRAVPLGLLVAAMGGAAFVGTLIFGAIGHRLPRRWTFGLGYTIGGSFRFWMLLVPALPVIIAWNVIAGLCIAPINPLADTVLQERIPAAMRAKVFASMSAGVLAGIPLGTFAGGYVAAWIGIRATLIIMGGIYLLTTFSLLVNPAMKKMDRV
ncbi:MAG TPA: MFS transporter [Ktedonobacteraceae bacterium]|nr:MFS transporter [Ktedonobacteraceae bacterium]